MGALVGIAGEPNRTKLGAAQQAMGVAGSLSGATSKALVGVAAANTAQLVDAAGRALAPQRGAWSGVADRTQVSGAGSACWFLDYSYVSYPDPETGTMRWRRGREEVFGPTYRRLPLIFDSGSYRMYLSGKAQRWMCLERFIQAILLARPEGYMSQDDPRSLEATLRNYADLEAALPGDPRHIPVWSCRWLWTEHPGVALNDLPGWPGFSLASLIPREPGQRRFRETLLEQVARIAIANAVLVARHPVFCSWVERHPMIAIGGLVDGPVHRLARHLYAAVLCALHPGLRLNHPTAKAGGSTRSNALCTGSPLRYNILALTRGVPLPQRSALTHIPVGMEVDHHKRRSLADCACAQATNAGTLTGLDAAGKRDSTPDQATLA